MGVFLVFPRNHNSPTMGEAANLAATAHAFNKILSHPKLSSVEENVKKLRRLILIEGIPSKTVRVLLASPCHRFFCSSAF